MISKSFSFSRKEYFQLVWSNTFGSLSDKYKIPIKRLKQICEDNEIPYPGPDYWARLRLGQNISSPKLPNMRTADNSITMPKELLIQLLDPLCTRINEIEDKHNHRLEVPEKLIQPHKFILEAKLQLNSPERHISDGLIFLHNTFLDINISPQLIKRSLRIMDSLLKLILERGHSVESHYGDTCIVILNEKIPFRLFELRRTIPSKEKWGTRKYSPTGRLLFQYGPSYNRKEIKEGKLPLEKQVAKIMAKVELYAEQKHKERLEIEKHQKIRERKERIRKARQERKIKELEKFLQLTQEANRFHNAKVLREYLNIKVQSESKSDRVNNEFEEWLEWAIKKIDWYDPLVERVDEILESDHREIVDEFFKNFKFTQNKCKS